MLMTKRRAAGIAFALVIGAGIWLRVGTLGYSNFQGGEVEVISFFEGSSRQVPSFDDFKGFLFEQSKGPVQFVINYLHVGLAGYSNEFLIRLPFCFFALLGFWAFYRFVSSVSDSSSARWAVALLATNGLFIAFSRIVQYQAVLFFLLPLSAYLFSLGLKAHRLWPIAFAGLVYGVAFLTHYDALSALPFFLAALVSHLVKNTGRSRFVRSAVCIFVLLSALTTLPFYGPFLAGQHGRSVIGYLGGRIASWDPNRDRFPHLAFYVPHELQLLLYVLMLIGLYRMARTIHSDQNSRTWRFLSPKTLYRLSLVVFAAGLLAGGVFDFATAGFATFVTAAVMAVLLVVNRGVSDLLAGLVVWCLMAAAAYFTLIADPRTHVYTAFLPGLAVAGIGIAGRPEGRPNLAAVLGTLVVIWGALCCWVIFIDTNPEYPFEQKRVLGRELKHYEWGRSEFIHGIYGFNHYRHWEKVENLYRQKRLTGSYSSNEKARVSHFYLPEQEIDYQHPANLIYVDSPHSWSFVELDTPREGYRRLYEFFNGERLVMVVYGRTDVYGKRVHPCPANSE